MRLAFRVQKRARAKHRRGQKWLDGQGSPKQAHQCNNVADATSEPAVLLGEIKSEPTEFGKLLPARLVEAVGRPD